MKRTVFFIIALAAFMFDAQPALAQTAPAQTNESATKQIEVKIYLQRTLIDPSGATSNELQAVKRNVAAAAPLRATLEALFKPAITAEEERENFSSPVFNLKFEGVTLKNGTALVRFSQPVQEHFGSLGPAIFADAVERTAKQFPTVKRVKFCAVGDTSIDSELLTPFPRCRK